MQVATTATVSAACLEALRMMLAVLEEPGGRIINPIRLTLTELMQAARVLLPVALPAAIAGAASAAEQAAGSPAWQVVWLAGQAAERVQGLGSHGCAACGPGGVRQGARSLLLPQPSLRCSIMRRLPVLRTPACLWASWSVRLSG